MPNRIHFEKIIQIYLVLLCRFETNAMPLTYDIPLNGLECLYEHLNAEEYATWSVFITTGAELKATAKFEGPIAPISVTTGTDLQTHIQKYARGERFGKKEPAQNAPKPPPGIDRHGNVAIADTVDFESAAALEKMYYDDDDADDDGKRRKRGTRMVGEPFQKTVRVVEPGWYRLCVLGNWYQISAEFELRKSSELGFSTETNHVNTYEEASLLEDEEEIDLDAAKEEDLRTAKTQVRTLHRILSSIRSKQENERHRLEVHSATNEHSHSRMVLSSLMETVLFMIVTGFQVYTVRKWFQGTPMLG